ncbi:hypothetical protein [Pseudoalteromonas sp. GW168-MNA-CIBAN-0100]|uniref:hypothetical protein n=1 Tax=Pseudoalteromonas sp. GW168-MNA-CIBAN-0100 TaxID=3140434 RepID=UPI00331B1DC6
MLVLQFLIILVSAASLIHSFLSLLNRKVNSAIIFSPVFFILYSLHTYLDVIYGMPNYETKFYNLKLAYENLETNFIYMLVVFLLNTILLFSQVKLRKYNLNDSDLFNKPSKLIRLTLYFLILVPFLLLFLSPVPSVYFNYGEIRGYLGTPVYVFHNLIINFTLLSALIITYLRFIEGREITSVKSTLLLIALVLDVYLNNKRTVMFIFLAYFLMDYYYAKASSILNKIKLFCGVVIFLSSYMFYANNIKYDDGRVIDEYLQYRIEFGRDDILKYSIYKTIVLGDDILDYPGQTFLGSIAIYVPRSIFEKKPYPYAQYLTNSLVWNDKGPALNGWSLTTSIVDEFVSNFKLWGIPMLIFFYISALFFANKFLINLKSLLLLCVFILWHFVHVVPFAPLLYFFMLLAFRDFLRLFKFR